MTDTDTAAGSVLPRLGTGHVRLDVADRVATLTLDRPAKLNAVTPDMPYERDLQTICFATEDAAEGRRAFAEKRTPVFRKR
ncbi:MULTISPECIES: hypothetical protein [Streptomyces]|uniref:hypothetical protein n=1 Tax=Streptomyces TaxID=1883 RepID=UPI0003A42B0F|nr:MULTISPECIES: hypothetical protein [Streptomyces]AOW85594.1 hypothetical protein BC342_02595 [Streptomyces olivaceus]MCC2270510.1 hypothetical protein [Streptomyces sp. CT1-17]GHJ05019.1 hypothetical protein TPA0906_68840 [Streptomyces olivaceus]